MPLLELTTGLPTDRLRELRAEALLDLASTLDDLSDSATAGPERRARGWTARALVADTVAWARGHAAPSARDDLVAEINLLYDVGIVAAEYYKLFVRDPTEARPAGRI